MLNKAIDLLYQAKEKKIEIILKDEQLQLKIPKNQEIDKNLLNAIRDNKYLLIDFLRSISKSNPGQNKIARITRDNFNNKIPLSFSQERLWFIDRLEGSVQYHIPIVLKLKGVVSKDALINALQDLVNRHEILRTVIVENDGIPYQHILPQGQFNLTVAEKSVNYTDVEYLQKYIRDLINRPFDLSKDYMLRGELININEEEHVLLMTVHHIAADGWSISIIVKEIIELYTAYKQGAQLHLSALQFQYVDYAVWQRKAFEEGLLQKKLSYWKDKLSGVAPLELQVDKVRPAVQSKKGANINYKINKELVSALQLLSQQQDATLFMTLLAAFKVLLYRYTGQSDICVGTPIAGRQEQEVEEMVGFFVNTLALRSKLTGTASFKDLLQQVRVTTIEAYDHQEVPFEKVVEAVVKERDISRAPLFQVMMVLQNTPDMLDAGQAEIQLHQGLAESTHSTSVFELTFYIVETADGLSCTIEYCTDLFNEDTIKMILSHFNNLLRSIVKTPEKIIALLPILGSEETRQLLIEFNNRDLEYTASKTIVDIFEQQAEQLAHHIALVFENQSLNYKELNERSNQFAHYLQLKGVQEGTVVPVCLERSINSLVAILGVLKAGATYIPIDPKYPEERISFMIDDVAARIAITTKECGQVLLANKQVDIVEIDGDWGSISKQAVSNLKVGITPGNLAYVIYTSGSTGRPKGVMVTHANVVSLVKDVDYVSLKNTDILLSTGSFSFDATTFEYWGMLLNGGQLILCKEKTLLDNKLLKQEIVNRKVNKMWFTSSWFNQLVDADITLFEKLETVLAGGEKLSEHHIEKLRQTYPAIKIINGYGPTENTTFSLAYNIKETSIKKPIPIGRPLKHRSVFILDVNNQLVPPGVSGEIFLSGAGLSKGYLNQPELTAQKFIKNPYSTGQHDALMYKSGDLGRWLPDGNIEFLGRMDEQVKIRGYRIELGEIQNVLHQSNLVTQSLVVAKEDNFGNKRLVSYVTKNAKFNKEAIIFFLRSKLPEYMVPSVWIELEQFPLTANGKIDIASLPDTTISLSSVEEYEAPANQLEIKMVEIWQHLLGLTKVGIHDNFFDLGGHSLNAMRLVYLIKKQMEMDVSINDIFIYPTIAGLLNNFIEKSENPLLAYLNIKYLVPIKAGGNRSPLYIMAGGGGTALKFKQFSEMLDAGQPVYVLQPPIDIKELKEFPDNVEGIAHKFIEEIMIHNADGPYLLSGHCLGGIIAFEMAKQLANKGKKVQLLTMFDTIINDAVEPVASTLKNLFHLPDFFRRSVSKISLKIDFELYLLKNHPRQSFLYKVNSMKSLLNKIRGSKSDITELHYAGLEIFNESSDLYVNACKKYKLVPYSGKIILFYAKEHYFFLDKLKNVGFKKLYLDDRTKNMWKHYATAVAVHDVEGEHSEIFDPVQGDEFALLLQRYLNNGQA